MAASPGRPVSAAEPAEYSTLRLRRSVLLIIYQGVIEEAEHLGKQLGMGSSQPRLHFDHGDEALFEILKGKIVGWGCYPQHVLVPGVAEPSRLSSP